MIVNGHRHRDRVDTTVAEIRDAGGEAHGIMANVGDPDAVAATVGETKEVSGPVDIAVSNVSIRRKQPFLEISVEDWHDTLNGNLIACFYLARCVIPDMHARKWGHDMPMSAHGCETKVQPPGTNSALPLTGDVFRSVWTSLRTYAHNARNNYEDCHEPGIRGSHGRPRTRHA